MHSNPNISVHCWIVLVNILTLKECDTTFFSDSHKHKDKYKEKEHKHKDHKKDKEREKSKHGNRYGVCFQTLHRCTFLHVGVCSVDKTCHPISAVFFCFALNS